VAAADPAGGPRQLERSSKQATELGVKHEASLETNAYLSQQNQTLKTSVVALGQW
jgi:hypothetical protein